MRDLKKLNLFLISTIAQTYCSLFLFFIFYYELVQQTESRGPNKQKTEGPNFLTERPNKQKTEGPNKQKTQEPNSYLTPNISIKVFGPNSYLTPNIYRVAKLTRHDIPSSKYTTSFFGLLVFCIFGLLVKKIRSSGFYLFGRPDSV